MKALPYDMNEIVGANDIVLMTLDSLRFDVAQHLFLEERIPVLAQYLPKEGWEKRHTPGNFTLAAHQAFFGGFLPTPIGPHPHSRPFACAFEGSLSITKQTAVFEAPTIVAGLADRGYHTCCIGGTGFFNKHPGLGSVMPRLFTESHWEPSFGVLDPNSAFHQIDRAVEVVQRVEQKLFLFVNVAATHPPTHFYVDGATEESTSTQSAALESVDKQLPLLFDAFKKRGPTWYIICSDHGTSYGEDGFWGHRLSHPVVWEVPYIEFLVEA